MISPRVRFVAIAVLAGCSSSGGGGGGGTVALTDFAAESAKVSCHRIYTCCDATERTDNSAPGPTEADCVTAMTAQLADRATAVQAGVTAGRITYHGDRARRCLDNAAALSCADWGVNFNMRYVPDCLHVAEGTVATGGACTLDEECASAFCGPTGCVARGALGDACTSPTGCQDGLYCPVSAGDHCATVGALGAECQVSVACQNNSCVFPYGATSGTCAGPMTCNGQ